MQSFRARFDAMVGELRAHPQIEVYHAVIRPPATDSALREVELELGVALPSAILDFYREHDGVFLEWGLRGHEYDAHTVPFEYPDYGQPPGCINLVPVADAMSTDWEGSCHVNEIQDDQWMDLYGGVSDPLPACGSVCIDNFSKYNHADLILGPEPLMVVSTDHGADMVSSDYLTFSTYLDMTLALYGTNRYTNGIGVWRRKAERVDAWTKRPTLDSLIAELLAK